MMPFRKIIEKNMEKIKDYAIALIAPSHGPMYRRPAFILDAYRSWLFDEPKNIVVLPYVSMHDCTRQMVNHLLDALIARGVKVERFNLEDVDLGKLAMALVDAATLVVGSHTVMTAAHPKAVYAAYLANALRPKLKYVSLIGSYGWGSKMVEQLTGMLSNLKVEMLEPVIAQGLPKEKDFTALDRLAETIASKHQGLNL